MTSAADSAYIALKQRLIGGFYPPGEQLKEEPLAAELAISRTPLRAALKRLVEDGLVTSDPNRGVRVAQWTDTDIEETYALRGLLEGHAAEQATRRGGIALADQLDELNRKMAGAIERNEDSLPEQLQQINARFHRAILAASGSPRLRQILESLIDMPIVLRSHFISTREDKIQSYHHHLDLAAAVRAGDADVARQIMQLHLQIASKRFQRQRFHP